MAQLTPVASGERSSPEATYALIAVVGITAVLVALGAGIVAGLYTGDLFGGVADPARSRGVIEATDTWAQQVMFLGASLLMTAVVVVLVRIRRTIGQRGAVMAAHLPALLRGGK